MQAVDYVVRDTAGRLFRGSLDAQAETLVLEVSQYSAVSLNLARDAVDQYVRVGDNLVITMEDGRELVLQDIFSAQQQGTRLYFSSGGEIYEISFSEAWGRTNYAHYGEAEATSGLVFSEGSLISTQLTGATTSVGYEVGTQAAISGAAAATPEVTMAAAPIFAGLGGAGASTAAIGAGAIGVGAIALGGSSSSDGDTTVTTTPTPNPPPTSPGPEPELPIADNGVLSIISVGSGADRVINFEEHAAGPVVTGQTFPDSLVTITFGSATLTTTTDVDGNYTVAFNPADINPGEYTTQVTATVVDPNGVTQTVSADVPIDTLTNVDINGATIEVDAIVLASELTDGVTVSGTSQSGAHILVTLEGENRATTADANGVWTVVFDGSVLSGINAENVDVTAQATDLYGNTASATATILVDTVLDVSFDAIQADDNIFNMHEVAAGVVVTGMTNPGAWVTVEVNGNTIDATVAADGSWSALIPTSALPTVDTSLTLQAHANDLLGNATSTNHVVYIDTQGRVDIDDTPLEIDDVVNLAEQGDGVTVTGTTTPGSTVVVYFHSFTGNAMVAEDGSWTVDVPASDIDLGAYDVTITATATTESGNMSTDTETVRIDTLVDTLTLSPGTVIDDSFVNTQEFANGVNLTGTVEPGSTVTVTFADVTKQASVDASGNWSVAFLSTDIADGDYITSMQAVAVDLAGNTHTITQSVHVDTVATNLTISAVPIEGDGIVNANEASDGIELNGNADPGTVITVTVGDVTYTTTAGPTGVWTVGFGPDDLPTGEVTIPVIVQTTDDAGNTTTDQQSLIIDTGVSNVDIPAGDIGGDGIINADEIAAGVVIAGQGEPGATVTLAVGNQEFTGVVGPDGTFAITIAAGAFPSGETEILINATIVDVAGNIHAQVLTANVDTELGNFAITSTSMDGLTVLNSISAQAGINLSGTVEIGSTVVVTFGETTKNASVDSSGNWSVTFFGSEVPIVDGQEIATVVATDAAGNTDTATTVFTMDTSVPAAPEQSGVNTTTNGIGGLFLATSEGDYSVYSMSGDSTSSGAIANDLYRFSGTGELYFDFNSEIPFGQDLVVQLNDDAGNSTSTLFVMSEETGVDGTTPTSVLDMGDSGYSAFNIEAVDMLLQGMSAEMTITPDQLENLSDLSDSLLVRGGADDTVTALGANNTGETRDIEGQTYEIYTFGNNGAFLVIDQDINVVT